jgi:hypothetical protein
MTYTSTKEFFNKGNRSKAEGQTNKSKYAYLAVLFFRPMHVSQPDGLGGGMVANKISASTCAKAGRIIAVGPPEPWLDPRLLTKEKANESKQKKLDDQGKGRTERLKEKKMDYRRIQSTHRCPIC